MQQPAKLSTGNRCAGSSPALSAEEKPGLQPGLFLFEEGLSKRDDFGTFFS